MKNLKALIIIFISLLILLILVFALERSVAGISFSDISFFKSEKISSYTIAEEIKDLYVLNTSEYRIKLIFPHDFVDRDVDWWKVKRLYEQKLTPEERDIEPLNIYRACINAGIDPAIDLYEFIILTAVIKAGINISGTVYENPGAFNEENLKQYIRIENENNEKSISLYIPDVEITEYYIEDRRPDNDNFPDAELTPGQWRDLVDFLNPLIVEKVVQLGILESAGENSRILIDKILKDSGYTNVTFTGKNL